MNNTPIPVSPDDCNLVCEAGLALCVGRGAVPDYIQVLVARETKNPEARFEFETRVRLTELEAREFAAMLLRSADRKLPEKPTPAQAVGWTKAQARWANAK